MKNMSNDYEPENLSISMSELVVMDATNLQNMENIYWSNYMKVKQALTVVKVIEKENEQKALEDKEQTKILQELSESE